jgi:hypothetical protein
MARRQSDREDLLREATALVTRAEFALPIFEQPIVCGFRRDGSASFFFGPDPVYQFNSACQLRRAFVGGRILKAERGKLVALSRQNTANEVALIRHELPDSECQVVLNGLSSDLQRLQTALQCGEYIVTGQVPLVADVAARVLNWLKNRPVVPEIAAAPNAR